MTEHTPGPWAWRHQSRGGLWLIGKEHAVMYVTRGGIPNATDQLLIAAAPDLLAAAKDAVDALAVSYYSFESDNPNNPLRGVCGECNQPWFGLDTIHQACSATKFLVAIKKLRAAIALAEGQS